MINLCPQRGCDAVYNLGPGDVGRTMTCKKCGTPLVVEADGLRIAHPQAEVVDDPSDASPRPARARRPAPARQETSPMPATTPERTVLSIFFTWLFALGTLLVVLFLFLPLLDLTRIQGKRAMITAGDRQQQRLDERLRNRDKDVVRLPDAKDKNADRKGPTERELERRKEDKEAWETKKKDLEDEVSDAETAARKANYAYTWGMLIGFLTLAVASVGFLSPSQPGVRRVVGAIVLAAQVLLVFLVFLVRSTVTQNMP
jgi:hypothetical protein